MVKVNPPFNIDEIFWINNPEYIYIEPFDKLYGKDKSRNKHKSSSLMWCFWLYTSKSQYNTIKNLPQDQKLKVIKRYYKDFDIEDKVIKEGIKQFNILSKSTAAKIFSEEEDTLVKRAESIIKMQDLVDEVLQGDNNDENAITPFSSEFQNLVKTIETLRKNTKPVYESYEAAKNTFMQEAGEETIYGGGKVNPMDKAQLPDLDDEEE